MCIYSYMFVYVYLQQINYLKKNLKSTLNVEIVRKLFYHKKIKIIETFYQLYWSKVKNIKIIILDQKLIISKIHGKELDQ